MLHGSHFQHANQGKNVRGLKYPAWVNILSTSQSQGLSPLHIPLPALRLCTKHWKSVSSQLLHFPAFVLDNVYADYAVNNWLLSGGKKAFTKPMPFLGKFCCSYHERPIYVQLLITGGDVVDTQSWWSKGIQMCFVSNFYLKWRNSHQISSVSIWELSWRVCDSASWMCAVHATYSLCMQWSLEEEKASCLKRRVITVHPGWRCFVLLCQTAQQR